VWGRRRSGGRGQGDAVAQRLELANVVAGLAVLVDAAAVVVRAEVVEAGGGVGQQVPDDHQDGAGDGDQGLELADASDQAAVALAEEGVGLGGRGPALGSGRPSELVTSTTHRRSDQPTFQRPRLRPGALTYGSIMRSNLGGRRLIRANARDGAGAGWTTGLRLYSRRPARRSAELLGEPDEKAFGPADVAEPIRVFVLDHFAADELRAVLSEPGERLVDVVHREHDAQVAEGVHRGVPVIGDHTRREKARELEPAVAVRRAHHGGLDALVAQSSDAPCPRSFHHGSPFELEAELAEELDRRVEVLDDDADVVHPFECHVPNLQWVVNPATARGRMSRAPLDFGGASMTDPTVRH
jgi:hypothetical protein